MDILVNEVKEAIDNIKEKDQKAENLNDQDVMVLLLASLMEEGSYGGTSKEQSSQ